jgi:hypothetical protein
MAEELWERRIIRDLVRLLEALLGFFERERPTLVIATEGDLNEMTTASPFLLHDNQSVGLSLALVGDNPNNLTIASAAWSVDQVVTVTPAADTLTAEVTTTPGTEGTATVTASATLSDAATLTATWVASVSAPPIPLTLQIVAGTPT